MRTQVNTEVLSYAIATVCAPQHSFILKVKSGSQLLLSSSLTGVNEVEAVSLRQKNKRGQVEQLVVSQMF